MSAIATLKVGGLETSNNPYSSIREGSLCVARNVIISSDNTAEPRPGQYEVFYGGLLTTSSGGFFGEDLYIYDGSQVWKASASIGDYTSVDDTLLRMKFVQTNAKLLFNTETGVQAVDSAGTVTPAGIEQPLIQYDRSSIGNTGTWFTDGNQVAFRFTFGVYDASGALHEGPPSDRIVFTNNSGGTKLASIYLCLPTNLADNSYVLRGYATDLSGGVSTDPGDTMYLLYEIPGTGPLEYDVVISDTVWASKSGSIGLYTNANDESILGASYAPPICKDMTNANGRTWFANTRNRHSFQLQLIGTGPTAGLQAGDTITINGETFNATSHIFFDGANTSGYDFKVFTSGTSSENVENTAKSLISAINNSIDVSARGARVTRAFYVSGPNDPPGKMYFEVEDVNAAQFSIYSSRTTCWDQVLTSSTSGAFTSSNNALPHALFYSKPDQSEAVPLLNYLLIGSRNYEIKRALPLRDKQYVFKDDGIFSVSGEEPFRVDLLDNTARLIAPDTACVLNNQIYALTTQGVVTVSDSGVRIISRPIEADLRRFMTPSGQSTVKRVAFGVTNEPDRQYQLWLPDGGNTEGACNLAYVYNTVTNTWVTWDGIERTWGATNHQDTTYYGTARVGRYAAQYRTGATSDFVDSYIFGYPLVEGVTVADVLVTSTTFDYASDFAAQPTVDLPIISSALDGIVTITYGEATQRLTVTDVGTGTGRWTFDQDVDSSVLDATAISLEIPFESEVRWSPFHYGTPGQSKQFAYATYHFAPSTFSDATAIFTTEVSPDDDNTLVSTSGGFGSSAWGNFSFGNPSSYNSTRLMVPLEKQRGAMLTVGFKCAEAGASWRLHGVTVEGDVTSGRTST